MDYTVQKLGQLAGISSRTLRYYDQIGILKPARINSAGYRIYSEKEVNRLQQILFYRELGIGLNIIKEILNAPSFDEIKALNQHRRQLLERRKQLDELLANVEKTITVKEGRIKAMNDKEKFAGFKQKMIDENERKYGQEIRAKYGNESIDKSNMKIKGMTEEQYQEFKKLGTSVLESLKEAMTTGNPGGELGQKTADLHRRWLSFSWDNYSKEAHAGLAQMYINDERFTAFYDQVQAGAAMFLRDAILIYTGVSRT